MKRLIPILVMSLAVLMSACVKPPQPKDIKFSILGDSYSTFEGYVHPETNDVWHYDSIGVTSAEQMWWFKVANKMGWALELNNSFCGSLVCNHSNFNAGSYYAPNSFLRRMNNLGNPDVIFILGGVNDVWVGAPFGDYVYSDWTEEQLCTIRPALACLFDGLKRLYPGAKLYFMTDLDFCPGGIDDQLRREYIESVHRIANHYHVDYIDLHDVQKTWWHPNVQGQENIANQMIELLKTDFNA